VTDVPSGPTLTPPQENEENKRKIVSRLSEPPSQLDKSADSDRVLCCPGDGSGALKRNFNSCMVSLSLQPTVTTQPRHYTLCSLPTQCTEVFRRILSVEAAGINRLAF
jgi:hypothetical protein